MKRDVFTKQWNLWSKCLPMACCLLCLSSLAVQGEIVTLTDGNSTFSIDPNSDAGAYSWTVDGVDQLAQQWFWYRLGDSGPEYPLNSMALLSVSTADMNGTLPDGLGDGDEMVSIIFTDDINESTVLVELKFLLTGGMPDSDVSDLSTVLSVRNISDTDWFDLHVFQYTNYDLEGKFDDLSVELVGENTVRQVGESGAFMETVITPSPNYFEAGLVNDLSVKFQNSSSDILQNINIAGPGNVAWAAQWDIEVPPGGSFIISEDNLVTHAPEPSALVLLGIGLSICCGLGLSATRR